MKVKQLREVLVRMDDDFEVVVTDLDQKGIAISGVSVCSPLVNIDVRQTFPGEWYKENGEEIDGRKYELMPNATTVSDFELDDELLGGVATVWLTVHDGYAEGHGVRVEYPKMADLTPAMIDEIDAYTGGRISDSGCVTPDDVLLKFGKVVSFIGLMDTTNAHDESLVRRINRAWAENDESFRPILCALYDRDISEIMASDAYSWPEAADFDYVYSEVTCNWKMHAYYYLKYIADDRDLEAILDFIRG